MSDILELAKRDDRPFRLQEMMAQLPQAELPTFHHFADGMYAREVHRPAGCLIVGKIHRREHFYIVTKGKVAVLMEGEAKIYEAPCVLISKPGTKRVVYAIEDSVCLTVHRTSLVDLDQIEEELIEPEGMRLFDSSNKIIAQAQEAICRLSQQR